jgi:hypothetical protein
MATELRTESLTLYPSGEPVPAMVALSNTIELTNLQQLQRFIDVLN